MIKKNSCCDFWCDQSGFAPSARLYSWLGAGLSEVFSKEPQQLLHTGSVEVRKINLKKSLTYSEILCSGPRCSLVDL